MGKRSDYGRVERDSYETPASAVEWLLPWLRPRTRFFEPCVGAGKLAGHLEGAGHVLVGSSDLPVDARSAHYDIPPGAVIITNPPYWSRPEDLHPLICNLSNQCPAWLLLPGNWPFNLGSAELVGQRCRLIVPAGRPKWIPNSPHSAMDDAAWYAFGCPDPWNVTRFIPRHERAANRLISTNSSKFRGKSGVREEIDENTLLEAMPDFIPFL